MPHHQTHTTLLVLLLIMINLVGVQRANAVDGLTLSSRASSVRISVSTYERIPIASLLAHPDRYQMRDIRLTGTIIAMQTETVPNRMVCGSAHERTALTVEDETGQIEVIDQGICGKNVGALKAPMLMANQRIDLLVQIMIPANNGTPGLPVETTIRYIELIRE